MIAHMKKADSYLPISSHLSEEGEISLKRRRLNLKIVFFRSRDPVTWLNLNCVIDL